MLNWKIINGLMIDGTGSPPQRADVGVQNDRIAVIGDLTVTPAEHIHDAAGGYVCPGFIDAHSHSDAYILLEPSAPSKIYQGVTTEITGNCGASAAPIQSRDYLSPDWAACQYPGEWRTFREYLQLLEKVRPAVNIGSLVGHGKLRQWVMGNAPRPATADEIGQMTDLLAECLDAGALGMSSGLIYSPGMFAAEDEVQALARSLADRGAIYTTHMRSEGAGLLESLDENIELARRTGVRVQISHLKTSGKKHWHLIDAALEKLHAARAVGIEIATDRYPYTAGHTDLDVIFPDWAAGGGRDVVLRRLRNPADRARLLDELRGKYTLEEWGHIIVASTANPEFRGCPLPEIATFLELDPAAAALHLIESDCLTTSAFFSGMSEANMWRILAEPYVMVGSDAALRSPVGPLGANHYHPRAYGTFPRFLKAAVAGRTVLLPEAVRKITSLPAEYFRISGRGLLAKGYQADITVFDPAVLDDPADYRNPHQLARGMTLVMVNGVPTIIAGKLTGARAGRIILS